MAVYFNEVDPIAAQTIRELIRAAVLPDGVVDERSVEDVTPDDLRGFTQHHFFAGIGVWSYALRNAGWPDNRPVWTGSCPCQPFSTAGQGNGFADERHLWPAWFWLIEQCRPSVIFGEQVASALGWFDLVSTDLEGAGYSVGAADLCAAGLGAPHIRQRLYWVADSDQSRLQGRGEHACKRADERATRSSGVARGMAHTDSSACNEGRQDERWCDRSPDDSQGPTGPLHSFWANADWLWCRDEKWRPVEPGTCPLDDGAPARVHALRAFGNAIVAPLAEVFIRAYCSARESGG